MTPEKFIEHVFKHRCVAIIGSQHAGRAAAAMEMAIEAGFRTVEFSTSTPGAFELISEFARRPGLVVGAGTVLDLETMEAAVAAGARFFSSPICDPRLLAAGRELDLAVLPGCATPTEMVQGYRAGAACQRLFPGAPDLAETVRTVLQPLPFLRILPVHGVDQDNAADVLAAGAIGVGFTTALFDVVEVESRQLDKIARRAYGLLSAVRHFTNASRPRLVG